MLIFIINFVKLLSFFGVYKITREGKVIKKVAFLSLFFILFVVCSYSSNSYAAGFALIEQSVSGLGNAYAGGAASALDATTIFYNPAGLARLQMPEFIIGGHIIIPSAKFTNDGSTHVLQSITGIPLRGNNGGNAGVTAFVPNIYFSFPVNEKFSFSIGINSPFGLQTDYDKEWVGRYHAIKSSVKTVNINPAFAYKIANGLSIGAGIDIQYIKAELTNAIDFGTIAFPALTPQGYDGFANLKGDSWAAGVNFGILYEFTKDTRVGFAYRSKIRQKLEGRAKFSDVPPIPALLARFKESDVTARLVLPDMASLSFYHDFNEQWAIMADVTWTGWKSFNELRIKYENPLMPDTVITTSWKNSMRYSIGVSYKPLNNLTLRAGVAYDETPIPDAKHRTPRIPDTDRTWIALGLGYKVSDKIALDFGYAHLFFKTSHIDKDPVDEDRLRGGLKGHYKGHVDITSLQLTYRF